MVDKMLYVIRIETSDYDTILIRYISTTLYVELFLFLYIYFVSKISKYRIRLRTNGPF
jgi:hypothetical protein